MTPHRCTEHYAFLCDCPLPVKERPGTSGKVVAVVIVVWFLGAIVAAVVDTSSPTPAEKEARATHKLERLHELELQLHRMRTIIEMREDLKRREKALK
jgi:hypothetical protein